MTPIFMMVEVTVTVGSSLSLESLDNFQAPNSFPVQQTVVEILSTPIFLLSSSDLRLQGQPGGHWHKESPSCSSTSRAGPGSGFLMPVLHGQSATGSATGSTKPAMNPLATANGGKKIIFLIFLIIPFQSNYS